MGNLYKILLILIPLTVVGGVVILVSLQTDLPPQINKAIFLSWLWCYFLTVLFIFLYFLIRTSKIDGDFSPGLFLFQLVPSILGVIIVLWFIFPGITKADSTQPVPNEAEPLKSVESATQNLERYRADVEALIRGTPSFADSQRRLARPQSLPNDPLDGMAPPTRQSAQQNTNTLLVFLTLSMPDEALAGWLDQTARAGGIAVIRGFHGDKLSTTLKRLTALQEHAPATKTRGGVSIDPTAFERFNVDIAPTVIVSSAPLPPCSTRGCKGDPAPAHDRIAGNITLGHALRLLAQNGDIAKPVAKSHLTQLKRSEEG